jgi:hypothetical protein
MHIFNSPIPAALPVLLLVLHGAAPVWADEGSVKGDSSGFERITAEIETARRDFHRKWMGASSGHGRNVVRREARQYLVWAIVEQIVPAWLGMPWTMAVIQDGLKPDAAFPFEAGKGISCSWFLVSVLRNAGLRFQSPRAFAGSIAVQFQYALAPRDADIHRFFNVSPDRLAKKIAALGEGLYVIGLNCHIGFVYVRGDRVEILHSSYITPARVVVEPVAQSPVIAASEKAGYLVSPIFQDTRLIDHWLTGTKVRFQQRPSKRDTAFPRSGNAAAR